MLSVQEYITYVRNSLFDFADLRHHTMPQMALLFLRMEGLRYPLPHKIQAILVVLGRAEILHAPSVKRWQKEQVDRKAPLFFICCSPNEKLESARLHTRANPRQTARHRTSRGLCKQHWYIYISVANNYLVVISWCAGIEFHSDPLTTSLPNASIQCLHVRDTHNESVPNYLVYQGGQTKNLV